ncbi:hypothetical protein SG09_02000 [Bradyrhizobium ottawaense]|jgi:hypothetical protein|nr:hypothetical protein SG09_02000 [Bradyrhizobium ottawaense]BBO09984.1 hypothetical protein TM102_14540 [Bradyrhizobium sp. TM102]GMO22542.1 hypothetical protein BwSF21_18040 [Bradyrhizobium ottawaense]GMO24369.1 hypothetical protein BwSF12_18920 [Bradyrhizobium ottawaense]GMO39059.1 hypothetical protein BwSH14_48680 [Bradyrhizobium ottawaense]
MPGQVSRKSSPAISASPYADLTGMPSGVTHGSTETEEAATEHLSKAILAKFGITLMDDI